MNSSERIKVLFWPGWWYPDRRNPVNGIFIRRHAEAVAPLVDLAVLYVTADPMLVGAAYETELDTSGVGNTIRVYYRPFPTSFPPLRIANIWRYFQAARRGIRELRTRWGNPDIVHLHVSPPWGQVLALRYHFSNIPFLFTEHWTGYHPANGEFRGFFRKKLNSWVVKNAFAVIAVSHDLQRVMENHGLRGQFVVIPNAVRTDLFCPPASSRSGGVFMFLHVSRLAQAKNVSGIIRAAAVLWNSHKDFRLLIVGHGKERPALEQLAGSFFPGGDCISFLGRKDENELAEIMRAADCLVLFSDYENLPCVVAEAQASGLPVIATRVGGVPEQVRPGMGPLVEPGDETGLVNAMAGFLDSKVHCDRVAIRRFAEENYSHAIVGKRFLRLYREALGMEVPPS